MSEFKSPVAQEIIEVLTRHRAEFDSRKRGQDWKAMISTIGFVFPEDRITITGMFYEPYKAPAGIEVGAKDATPPATSNATAEVYKPCTDCPEEIKMVTGGPKVISEKAGTTEHLRTAAGVIEAFQGDLPIMMRHVQLAGIKIGRRNKVETVAEAIAEHYSNNTAEQE